MRVAAHRGAKPVKGGAKPVKHFFTPDGVSPGPPHPAQRPAIPVRQLANLYADGKEADTQGRPVLNLVRALCSVLAAERVAYCHWKSNAALDRSASGDNDLDLLVSRSHARLFTEILFQLAFKEARVSSKEQLPGVLHYYGCDEEGDRLVHVHAHYQLIVGDDMTKNYRVPIETPFLESAIQDDLFKIPAPEYEFIIFVIRMVAKHSTWDAILSGRGAFSAVEGRELEYLMKRANLPVVYKILQNHLPFLGPTLFDGCVKALQPHCSTWTRIKVGHELQGKLQGHARRSQLSDAGLKFWRRAHGVIRQRILRRPAKKRLAGGGAIIAIVGGDGAGKTTAVDGLYAWLSRPFATTKVHMGKPPQSLGMIAARGATKISSRLGGRPLQPNLLLHAGTGARVAALPTYLWLLWRVLMARDRYRAYVKARRLATNGDVVICDRYPLSQIKSMDGPLPDEKIATGILDPVVRFMVQAERSYYQHILLPDLLMVLRIDPEIAVARRTDDDATAARIRCQEIWVSDWQETGAHLIDAGRARNEVLGELKHVVWSRL